MWLLSILFTEPGFSKYWTPLILAFWLVILPKGIPIYVSPVLGFQSAACHAYTAFSWVLGMQTPVLVLVCQTLYYWVTSMTPELVLNVLFVTHLPLSLSSDPFSFQKLYLFTGANMHLIACVWRPEKDLQEAGSLLCHVGPFTGSSQHLYPLNRALSPSDQFLKFWRESLI